MIKKILAILAGVGAFFSALFYVLFKQAKDEKKYMEEHWKREEAEKQLEAERVAREAEQNVAAKKSELEKEDKKLEEQIHSGNSLDSFNAGLDMLRRQSERGNKRNSSSGNCRT